MHDCCPDLAFDIVANHRQIGLFEAILPVLFTRNKHWNTVDKTYACLEDLFNIPLGRCLGANGKVIYHHICACIFEDFYNIISLLWRLGNYTREVFAQPIVCHSTMDFRFQLRNFGKAIGIIRRGENGFAEIFTHLILVNIKGCSEFYITDMIPTQVYMHQTWDKILWLCFAVVLHALHERTCTVTDSNNRNTHFLLTSHTSYRSFPGIIYLNPKLQVFKAIHTIPLFLLDCY